MFKPIISKYQKEDFRVKKNSFFGGVHIDAHKEFTNTLSIITAPAPKTVYIPLSQHIGVPCQPIVKIGDEVKMGQMVGESRGFVSIPVHSSVSGRVTGIQRKPTANGRFVDCIVIQNDFEDTLYESIIATEEPDKLTAKEILEKITNSGVAGMGGATFPTHVKLSPPPDKNIEYIILNGIECEPFLTADHRILVERSEKILQGLIYLLKTQPLAKGLIAIEDNKPDAIQIFSRLLEKQQNISLVICPEKYPQGSEKQLIYACLEREVPAGGLPSDVGVIVQNVGTAAAITDAVEQNMPLIERVLTINGNGIAKPQNLSVRIGTLYSDLVELAGGFIASPSIVISGGLMMGTAVFTLDIPVTKGTSGILVFNDSSPFAKRERERDCARCAKCVDVCPMSLEPSSIAAYARKGRWEDAERFEAISCVECGSCAFVCPCQIPLVQYIRLAKQYITSKGQGPTNPLVK